MINIFKPTVKEVFNAEILSCQKAGGGASGVVYKLEIDKQPFTLAIKTAKNADMLKKECDYIRYISALVDIKFPKIYYEVYNEINFVIMEFFDGVNCSDKYLLKAPKSVRIDVAEQVADNIIKLQKIKGNKFGDLFNPIYDNWNDYYRPFVNMVLDKAIELTKEKFINDTILDALKLGIKHYNQIFAEPVKFSTPIHGDYWAQNVMIDKNFKLIGVVDPFNCMWADSEYELFAFNAIYGKKLPVLEAFLKKEQVSKNFFLKNAFYILVSETYWVYKLHHNNIGYLIRLSRNFKKQLKKFKIV